MKTLILYATKHGATREIAERLARRMEDATLADLKSSAPAPDGYDRVLIGSSVYAGRLRKEARAYVARHADALKTVPLGLFVSGMSPEGAKGYLDANYPKGVAARARATAMLGGIFDPAKSNPFERLVMRAVAKESKLANTLSDEKIDQFLEAMEE